MNDTLREFARKELKALLADCTEGQVRKFGHIFCWAKMKESIDVIVEAVPDEDMDQALTICQRQRKINSAGKDIDPSKT